VCPIVVAVLFIYVLVYPFKTKLYIFSYLLPVSIDRLLHSQIKDALCRGNKDALEMDLKFNGKYRHHLL
jgi:hypothetical protein